jgi:hypothetical protein
MSYCNHHFPSGYGENISKKFNSLEIKQKTCVNNIGVPLHNDVDYRLKLEFWVQIAKLSLKALCVELRKMPLITFWSKWLGDDDEWIGGLASSFLYGYREQRRRLVFLERPLIISIWLSVWVCVPPDGSWGMFGVEGKEQRLPVLCPSLILLVRCPHLESEIKVSLSSTPPWYSLFAVLTWSPRWRSPCPPSLILLVQCSLSSPGVRDKGLPVHGEDVPVLFSDPGHWSER